MDNAPFPFFRHPSYIAANQFAFNLMAKRKAEVAPLQPAGKKRSS